MPIQAPYGDIYSAGTPALDRLSQQLYAQQRQRELYQQQQNKALNDEFARNMAGIRDADITDLTKAYGEFKSANQNLMRLKHGVSPEMQMDLLRKKAAIYDVISKSKFQREQEKQIGTDIMKNGKAYTKDAHNNLIGVLKTPVKQLGDTDWVEPLKYKGNMTSWGKLLNDAKGQLKEGDSEMTPNPNGLQNDVLKIKRYNNPLEYYDKIRSGIVGSQQDEDFDKTFGTFTPEVYNLTEQHYNQMMADQKNRKRFGLQEGIDLPPDELLTEPEKTAKFLAMQHALLNPPVTSVGPSVKNEKAIMQERSRLALNNQEIMQAIRFGDQVKLAKIKRGWAVADQTTQNAILDNVMEDWKKDPGTIPEAILKEYEDKDAKGHPIVFSDVQTSPDGAEVEMSYVNDDGEIITKKASFADIKERRRKQIETTQTNTGVMRGVKMTGEKHQNLGKKKYNPATGKFE